MEVFKKFHIRHIEKLFISKNWKNKNLLHNVANIKKCDKK